jgi:magnesium transporter
VSQGPSWFPLPRRVPARRNGRDGAATIQAPPQRTLSAEEIGSAVVDCGLYDAGQRLGGRVELESALRKADGCQDGFVWIGLHDPSPGVVEAVGEHFRLHPLAVEDAVHGHERAKLEVFGGDTLFVVLKTARYVDSDELIEIGEVMVFIGPRFVVSVRHGEGSPLHDVRLDLEAHPDLLSIGPSSVLYGIADRIIDDYVAVLDGIAVDVEEVEAEVFSGSLANPAERIYRLKREVLGFRRAASALVGPIQRLSSEEAGLPLDPRTGQYFRDVYDHLIRDVERIAGFDDLLTNALQANLAQVAIRDNRDMRRISAWVAIAVVPTMIFGLYGMNFEHMPELGWTFGYPAVLLLVVIICAVLYRKFKRTGWL